MTRTRSADAESFQKERAKFVTDTDELRKLVQELKDKEIAFDTREQNYTREVDRLVARVKELEDAALAAAPVPRDSVESVIARLKTHLRS